jgi:hypothetical protein
MIKSGVNNDQNYLTQIAHEAIDGTDFYYSACKK